jgi:hypothetical protein
MKQAIHKTLLAAKKSRLRIVPRSSMNRRGRQYHRHHLKSRQSVPEQIVPKS